MVKFNDILNAFEFVRLAVSNSGDYDDIRQ
jgi:hypothetical protein